MTHNCHRLSSLQIRGCQFGNAKSHAALLLRIGGDKMAFSSSSYIVGVGTAFAAIALGFAGGAMITTSAVQPQNRLERVTSNAPLPSTAPSSKVSEQANVTTPPAQQPPQAIGTASSVPPAATAPSTPAADSQPVQQPQPPAPVAAKIDAKIDAKTDAATNAQQPLPASPPMAKSENAPPRSERASVHPAEMNREASRSAEPNRESSRKRGEERKFTERRRRQDLQDLDEATNVVRQMRRDGPLDEVVERNEAPRIIDSPPRRFGLFGRDDDSPRVVNEPPPRFGLFGN
jgi:hypothetical protein